MNTMEPEEKSVCREIVTKERLYERLNNAIKECEMTIMREGVKLETLRKTKWNIDEYFEDLEKHNLGHCKECKYFEYDSVAKVDGIPLIVAHEMYNKWGDGCKTKEDGYCFLFEPRESEE